MKKLFIILISLISLTFQTEANPLKEFQNKETQNFIFQKIKDKTDQEIHNIYLLAENCFEFSESNIKDWKNFKIKIKTTKIKTQKFSQKPLKELNKKLKACYIFLNNYYDSWKNFKKAVWQDNLTKKNLPEKKFFYDIFFIRIPDEIKVFQEKIIIGNSHQANDWLIITNYSAEGWDIISIFDPQGINILNCELTSKKKLQNRISYCTFKYQKNKEKTLKDLKSNLKMLANSLN